MCLPMHACERGVQQLLDDFKAALLACCQPLDTAELHEAAAATAAHSSRSSSSRPSGPRRRAPRLLPSTSASPAPVVSSLTSKSGPLLTSNAKAKGHVHKGGAGSAREGGGDGSRHAAPFPSPTPANSHDSAGGAGAAGGDGAGAGEGTGSLAGDTGTATGTGTGSNIRRSGSGSGSRGGSGKEKGREREGRLMRRPTKWLGADKAAVGLRQVVQVLARAGYIDPCFDIYRWVGWGCWCVGVLVVGLLVCGGAGVSVREDCVRETIKTLEVEPIRGTTHVNQLPWQQLQHTMTDWLRDCRLQLRTIMEEEFSLATYIFGILHSTAQHHTASHREPSELLQSPSSSSTTATSITLSNFRLPSHRSSSIRTTASKSGRSGSTRTLRLGDEAAADSGRAISLKILRKVGMPQTLSTLMHNANTLTAAQATPERLFLLLDMAATVDELMPQGWVVWAGMPRTLSTLMHNANTLTAAQATSERPFLLLDMAAAVDELMPQVGRGMGVLGVLVSFGLEELISQVERLVCWSDSEGLLAEWRGLTCGVAKVVLGTFDTLTATLQVPVEQPRRNKWRLFRGEGSSSGKEGGGGGGYPPGWGVEKSGSVHAVTSYVINYIDTYLGRSATSSRAYGYGTMLEKLLEALTTPRQRAIELSIFLPACTPCPSHELHVIAGVWVRHDAGEAAGDAWTGAQHGGGNHEDERGWRERGTKWGSKGKAWRRK
ncbi:unnamed protein product [Closterium sp. Naga37s-1]|nr:unnamed protein product [Closterium sp. Naga37s-1]